MNAAEPTTPNTTMTLSPLHITDNDVTDSVLSTVVGRYRSSAVAGATGSSAWLWAPHVAIGALLVALMAASFVRFHCKYGHKYRTGSQFLSANGFRTAPKSAWMSDKKGSSSSYLPTVAGMNNTFSGGPGVGMTVSSSVTGRSSRSVAVIVLRPVGEPTSGSKNQLPVGRRSADPVLFGSSSAKHDSLTNPFPEVIYTTATTSAGSSNMSVDTAHVQQQAEANFNKESLTIEGKQSLKDNRKQRDMEVKTWNNGLKTNGNNGPSGEIISVDWTLDETAAAASVESSIMSGTSMNKAYLSSQLVYGQHQQPHLQQPLLVAVDSMQSTVGTKHSKDTVRAPAIVANAASGGGMTQSNWSWPSTVNTPATASSLRGTLMRRQPTMSPSGGESDTEKLLLLDDCEDKLLIL